MSRVFISAGTGAGIYVFSDDHCPTHIHARHRGEGWIARVRFSFLDSTVELISIAPVKNIPLQRVVNRTLERCSTATAGLPTWLVADARNDLFGESVGDGEQSGKD
jgi:hypothetical protein